MNDTPQDTTGAIQESFDTKFARVSERPHIPETETTVEVPAAVVITFDAGREAPGGGYFILKTYNTVLDLAMAEGFGQGIVDSARQLKGSGNGLAVVKDMAGVDRVARQAAATDQLRGN